MALRPLISVTVNLYNYERFISDCIQSILNQTYTNFELIVVDDCSTDNSYKTAKKFEEKDKRVKVIKLDKNSGIGKAKNEGIVISKGEYIVTLDADDMMTKNSLEVRLKAALKYNVPFVYADAILVYNDIKLKECYRINHDRIKCEKMPHFATYNPSLNLYNIHAQSIMIKRNIFEEYGLFDENLRSRSDREMWWRLFGKDENDKVKISSYHLHEIVAYYRYHVNSMWRKRKRDKKYDNIIIRKSEKSYKMRKKYGINKENTRFLEN